MNLIGHVKQLSLCILSATMLPSYYALPEQQVSLETFHLAPLHQLRLTFYHRNAIKDLPCCFFELIRRELCIDWSKLRQWHWQAACSV